MSRSIRNPFLKLPVTEGNDVEKILIHADHILQIEESDPLSCTVTLTNGESHEVELSLEDFSRMLNQVYGHEVTSPAILEDRFQ